MKKEDEFLQLCLLGEGEDEILVLLNPREWGESSHFGPVEGEDDDDEQDSLPRMAPCLFERC